MPLERDNPDPLSGKIDRLKQSIKRLPTTATNLNIVTDGLTGSINELDATLKKFSLGVPVWVTFASSGEPEPGYNDDEDVGYVKIGGKWGLAIRTVKEAPGRADRVEEWLFNEAPRYLRVRAADKIPEVIEALITKGDEMTRAINEKANGVQAVIKVMNDLLTPNDTKKAEGK